MKLGKKRYQNGDTQCVFPVFDGDIVLLFLRSLDGVVYSEPLRYYAIIRILILITLAQNIKNFL